MNKESILKRLFKDKHITVDELLILSKETIVHSNPTVYGPSKDNPPYQQDYWYSPSDNGFKPISLK